MSEEKKAVHLPQADESCSKAIARQIEKWYESGQESTQALMNTIMEQLKAEGTVLVPVELGPSFLQALAQAQSAEQLQALNQQVGLQSVYSEDGVWYVAFTSVDQAGEVETSTMPFYLRQLMTIAMETEDCAGLVINPWSEQTVSIPKAGIQVLLEQAPEMTADEKDYAVGEKAYKAEDYANAVMYLERAAEAGNAKAISLLGDCYYYGRGVGKDKGKARGLWEQGAAKEDANAAGKLADMYQTGDLEPKPGFANALYHRSYDLARRNKALDCYPDACLRMLKYCKADFSENDYENLAWDAVEGFRERVEMGDKAAEKLLKSAQSYLDYIEAKKAKYRPGME